MNNYTIWNNIKNNKKIAVYFVDALGNHYCYNIRTRKPGTIKLVNFLKDYQVIPNV